MSAIWGAVNLTGGEIAKEEIRLLKAAFAKCRIDRYEEICAQHIYMGCGIQYFVPQAKEEQLPCTESVFTLRWMLCWIIEESCVNV